MRISHKDVHDLLDNQNVYVPFIYQLLDALAVTVAVTLWAIVGLAFLIVF
jgi:hypothetical protein